MSAPYRRALSVKRPRRVGVMHLLRRAKYSPGRYSRPGPVSRVALITACHRWGGCDTETVGATS
jgi:hypothetical protein